MFPGGNLGLFTGISIVSMCEFVFWLLKLLDAVVRRNEASSK